jgi:hypothetical protein
MQNNQNPVNEKSIPAPQNAYYMVVARAMACLLGFIVVAQPTRRVYFDVNSTIIIL